MHKPLIARRRLLQSFAAVAAGALPVLARAATEAYPTHAAKLIIPFPAGGATDYAARAIGTALSQLWSQPVVFDNRVGAGSTIGTEFGARSAPDGYTLVPVAGFATSPLVMVVPANSPFKTFPELVAFAKANPGKLSYASNGSGSLP